MESVSAMKLYGQLMTLMLFCLVIQCFSCFSNMAFHETSVSALWQPMKLLFPHYGIICISCFFHDSIKLISTLNVPLYVETTFFLSSRLHSPLQFTDSHGSPSNPIDDYGNSMAPIPGQEWSMMIMEKFLKSNHSS